MSGADELDEAIALANHRGTDGPPPPRRETAARPYSVFDPDPEPEPDAETGPDTDLAPGDRQQRGKGNGRGSGARDKDHGKDQRSDRGEGHGRPEGHAHAHEGDLPWREAHALAARTAEPLGGVTLPLDRALHHTLAEPLPALTDLPPFDTSAMDGWAVSGPGPWELPGGAAEAHGILAGDLRDPAPLPDGHAIRIATGARIPPGANAVLRSEYGEVRGVRLRTPRTPQPGTDIRPRGQESRSGDRLLPAGTRVTPPVLGLAAAAGYDELALVRRPRAEVLVLGEELLHRGLPAKGRIRDALGPMVGPWLTALGAETLVTRRLGDDAEALHEAVATTTADLVVTTGGTASGPVDHVHPTLRRLGAHLLVDGVRVRPGHPMLLARLRGGGHLVGLPGNPLAALSGLVTLAEPLIRTLSGAESGAGPVGGRAAREGEAEGPGAPLAEDVHGHPRDTRLVPVTYSPAPLVSSASSAEPLARPLHYAGPAMLRGIAAASAFAVIPPGGAAAGSRVRLLALPW